MSIDTFMDKDVLESSNDITTPMPLVREIVHAIPERFFCDGMRVLDPCVGMGNFLIGVGERASSIGMKVDMTGVDLNEKRTIIAKKLLPDAKILTQNFFDLDDEKFDLILANPPYAKINNGQRSSKNHNLFPSFISKSLEMLAPGGAIAFLVPTSWMSFATRNTVATQLLSLNMVRLDVGTAKKYFPKVGSSFSWFVCVDESPSGLANVTGKFKSHTFESDVLLRARKFIPLLSTKEAIDILDRLMTAPREFVVETTSDLHATTKKAFLTDSYDEEHPYKVVHTRKQTKWSSRPHKYQDGIKVFICLTSTYDTWIDECGVTQSAAFVRCDDREHADRIKSVLDSVPFRFAVAVTRYGNFVCVPLIQAIGTCDFTEDELEYMEKFI
jgi:hypothetical protein